MNQKLTEILQETTHGDIQTPFSIELKDNNKLICNKILRHLPKKRLVVLANWNNQNVVAKIFFNKTKATMHFEREIKGNQILQQAKIPTPKILFSSKINSENCNVYVLIFNRLYPEINIKEVFKNKNSLQEYSFVVTKIISAIAKEHKQGIYSNDLHPDNFIYANNDVYVIDTADIKCKKFGKQLTKSASLKYIAQLLSQIAPHSDYVTQNVYPIYAEQRNWPTIKNDLHFLQKKYEKSCAKNANQLLRKIFRNSTKYIFKKTFRRLFICERVAYTKQMQELLHNPDKFITKENIIKAGNTCTVTRLKLNDKYIVIKRYNIKSFWHAIKRSMQCSRAAKCWKNSHLLLYYNISTPKPIAFLEKRYGVLRNKSYYISEYVPGTLASNYFVTEKDPIELNHFATKMINIIYKLKHLAIRHGDMKANNFIITDDNITLIDLDGMRKLCKICYSLEKAFKKDLNRFFKNWENSPKITNLFLSLVEKTHGL